MPNQMITLSWLFKDLRAIALRQMSVVDSTVRRSDGRPLSDDDRRALVSMFDTADVEDEDADA